MSRPHASVFIATSLDGFIAREDGSLDWLVERGYDADYGFREYFATIDTFVLGRHTFEVALGFGGWPYKGKRVVVLTSREIEVPEAPQGMFETHNLEPPALMLHLAETGARRLYVDGGQTIQRFLRAGLIDELIITRIPVLLGAGIPLFGELDEVILLEHVETTAFPEGLVQSRYRVLETLSSTPGA